MRKLLLLTLLFVFILSGVTPAAAQDQTVLVVTVEGVITPAIHDYLARGVQTAAAQDASALVVHLNTPGGALDATLKIVALFRSADVPIIVYVTPSGGQAASAGSIITLAAHAGAMAPQTIIGAASPINADGSDINETAYRKQVEDLKATMRTLTESRPATATSLAEAMIEDARAISAREAIEAGLIDFIAEDTADLLAQLDGHEVMVNGQAVQLATASANTRTLQMSLIEQLLHLLTNPIIISILLLLGVQAIIIELKSPGGWVAGFTGVVCLALGLYGLGQISANWFGLILIFTAFVLFVMEIQTPVFGGFALAGIISMVVGLMVLFNTANSSVNLSLPAAVAISLSAGSVFIFIITKVAQIHKKKPTTGQEGLVGQVGVVRTPLTAKGNSTTYTGMALIFGELWNVQAAEPIARDESVVVTAVNGFTLQVQRK